MKVARRKVPAVATALALGLVMVRGVIACSSGGDRPASATTDSEAGVDARGTVVPADSGDTRPDANTTTYHLDSEADCAAWTRTNGASFTAVQPGYAGAGACRLCGPEQPLDHVVEEFVYQELPPAVGEYTISGRFRQVVDGGRGGGGPGLALYVVSKAADGGTEYGGTFYPSEPLDTSWKEIHSGTGGPTVVSLTTRDGSPVVLQAGLSIARPTPSPPYAYGCYDVDEITIAFRPQ